jgi:hypothetical protein
VGPGGRVAARDGAQYSADQIRAATQTIVATKTPMAKR